MQLIRYKPFVPKRGVNNFFDDFFKHSLTDFVGSDSLQNRPAVNILETEADLQIEVAAPGLHKGDFELNLEDNKLIISAEREKNEDKEEKNYRRREFSYHSFRRVFQLPEMIDMEGINATYENGVLLVSLPKTETKEEEKVRQIEIK